MLLRKDMYVHADLVVEAAERYEGGNVFCHDFGKLNCTLLEMSTPATLILLHANDSTAPPDGDSRM